MQLSFETELDICNAFYLTDCLDETASDNHEPIGEVVHKAPGEDEAFTHQLNSEADPSVLYDFDVGHSWENASATLKVVRQC
ncbi:4140_t:CDS:2 [Paraglomus occultum]|uniref:4140_t:CDS:1 n=1 Tax=Paraglomus occultum TaxID=144539 RepID=A0A9N9D6V9_9GLOM|nr:4140_t:CDS:2 [Paraglomus occultum]